MMIAYVEVQLCAWGRWAQRQAARSVGYPSVSPMFRDMKAGGGYGSREPFGVDEYVQDTDLAVKRLPVSDIKVCYERYQRGGSAQDVAARLGVSKPTMFRRLDAIHQALVGHMNDIEVERDAPRSRLLNVAVGC